MSLFIQEGGLILMLTFRFHFTHQFWTQWPKLDNITYLMKLEQSLSLKFLSPDINLLSMYGFCLPWIYLIVSPYLIIVIAFIMKNCRGWLFLNTTPSIEKTHIHENNSKTLLLLWFANYLLLWNLDEWSSLYDGHCPAIFSNWPP